MKHIAGREKKINTQKASEMNSYQVTPKHFTKKKKKQCNFNPHKKKKKKKKKKYGLN